MDVRKKHTKIPNSSNISLLNRNGNLPGSQLQYHNLHQISEQSSELFVEDLDQEESNTNSNHLVLAFLGFLVILSISLFFL
ncbi:MAG: hypothetical protein EA341_00085 [Mongoliibacter sp.]|uniref:hypothetical protein n=1 Tax=Mongoliibacter sp. TaxID=2022438 RepID=UPI0012EF3F01|nr:hypothetical protein [Mongoliibacter sp.]TVP54646.1 MAG: hypothetical protein EA341_00085 [Mongoliibacter sp.]